MDATRVVNIRSKEKYDVYIGRPSVYGNPFAITEGRDRAAAIELYKTWVRAQPDLMKKIRKNLKGKTLGCFCKPEACHGDVLVEIAEGRLRRVDKAKR
jgi:hypothetical protein